MFNLDVIDTFWFWQIPWNWDFNWIGILKFIRIVLWFICGFLFFKVDVFANLHLDTTQIKGLQCIPLLRFAKTNMVSKE